MNRPIQPALARPKHFALIQWLALVLAMALLLALGTAPRRAMAADVPIAVSTGLASAPAAAANPKNGRFLVVWTDTLSTTGLASGSFDRILGRWVDAKGQVLGNAFVVSQRAGLDSTLGGSRPAVAYNSRRDEFLVVYDRGYEGSAENGIFAQRVGADGILLGGEIPLFPGAAQRVPGIAYDSVNDRYLVVWAGGAGLFGLVLGGDGQALATIMRYAPAGSGNPVVAFSPTSGGYLLAYETAIATATAVVGLAIQADGAAVRGPFAIGAGTGRQATPFIGFDSTLKRFLVVWADGRDDALLPAAYAQLVAENGDLIGANLKLAESALSPRVVYSPVAERYLLSWQIADPASTKSGYVAGRIFRPDLAPSGARLIVSDAAAMGRPFPAADPASSNGFLAWAGQTQARFSAIFGQAVGITDPAPKVSMAMAAEPAVAKVGATLTYTVRIENNGRAAAKSAVLKDKLPAGLRFVAAKPDQGQCSLKGNTVRCPLGNIAVGAGLDVILTVEATDFGSLTSTATLTWTAGGGSATFSKSAKATVTVKYGGELALLAPQSGETLPAGTAYPIRWQVTGTDPADELSFRLQYSLDNGSHWTTIGEGIVGDSYTWQVATPRRGKKALVRITGFVDGRPFATVKSKPFRIEVSG